VVLEVVPRVVEHGEKRVRHRAAGLAARHYIRRRLVVPMDLEKFWWPGKKTRYATRRVDFWPVRRLEK
jgi:hypothetical protein